MESIIWLPSLLSAQPLIAQSKAEPDISQEMSNPLGGLLITVDPPPNEYSYSILFFFFFGLFRAASEVYGGSQARGRIGAGAPGLHHSHSNAKSELSLPPTPQLMAMVDA